MAGLLAAGLAPGSARALAIYSVTLYRDSGGGPIQMANGDNFLVGDTIILDMILENDTGMLGGLAVDETGVATPNSPNLINANTCSGDCMTENDPTGAMTGSNWWDGQYWVWPIRGGACYDFPISPVPNDSNCPNDFGPSYPVSLISGDPITTFNFNNGSFLPGYFNGTGDAAGGTDSLPHELVEVVWKFSADHEWGGLDFQIFAMVQDDWDVGFNTGICDPAFTGNTYPSWSPGYLGAYCGSSMGYWYPQGYVAEGTFTDCTQAACSGPLVNKIGGDGTLGAVLYANGFTTLPKIVSPLVRTTTVYVVTAGSRPPNVAYIDDTIAVVMSVTNSGGSVAITPCVATTLAHQLGSISVTSLADPSCGGGLVAAGSPPLPFTMNTGDTDTFVWTWSADGAGGCIAAAPALPGGTGSGQVFWDANVNGALDSTATMYIQPAPVDVTVTMWVDPDAGGPLPFMPLGPGATLYFMSGEWVEARATFTNTDPTNPFEITPLMTPPAAPFNGYQMIGTPVWSTTLLGAAPQSFTWRFQRDPVGLFASTCEPPGNPVFAGGVKGVCFEGDAYATYGPFDAFNIGPHTGTMSFDAPGVAANGADFPVVLTITNTGDRPFQLDAPVALHLGLSYNGCPGLPGLGGSAWISSGPVPALPATWLPNETKSFTWMVHAATTGYVCSDAGLTWGACPSYEACVVNSFTFCTCAERCTNITPPTALSVISFAAAPGPYVAGAPTQLLMGLRNASATDTVFITSFCGGWMFPTSPGGMATTATTMVPSVASYDGVNPPVINIDIPPSSTCQVIWNVTPNCGSMTFGCGSPAVAGTDTAGGAPTADPVTAPSITASAPPLLSCSVWVDRGQYSVGQKIRLFFTLSNNGGDDGLALSLTVSAATTGALTLTLTAGGLPGAGGGTLPGTGSCNPLLTGSTTLFEYDYLVGTNGSVPGAMTAQFTAVASVRDAAAGVLAVSSCCGNGVPCQTPRVTVANAAQLACSAISTSLVTLSVTCTGCTPIPGCGKNGGGCIQVTMTAQNHGDIDLAGVTPSCGWPESTVEVACLPPVPCSGTGYALLAIPPVECSAPVIIPAGGGASFTWTYTPSATGCVAFHLYVTGHDAATGATLICDTRTNCTEILGRSPVQLRLMAAPTQVSAGQTFVVDVEIYNPCCTAVRLQGGEPGLVFLSADNGGNLSDEFNVSTPGTIDIPSGQRVTIPITVTVLKTSPSLNAGIFIPQGGLFIVQDLETALAVPVVDTAGPLPLTVVAGDSSLAVTGPNPVKIDQEAAAVTYRISDPGNGSQRTKLKVYTISGEWVATLVDEPSRIVESTVPWDGRNASGQKCASGVYLIRLEAPNFTAIKKLALVR